MKKIWFVMMAVAALLAFPGCSSDDDDNGTIDNGKKYLAEITVKEYPWKFGERSTYGEDYENYKYDEKGNLLEKETNYYSSAANTRIYHSYKYTYDDRNRVVVMDEWGLSTYKYKYQYNEFDSVSVMQKYSKNGSLNETHTYEYDSSRRLIKDTEVVNYVRNDYGYIHVYSYSGNTKTEVTTMLEDGAPFGTYIWEYDAYNNLIRSTWRNDETGKETTSEYQYEYDSKGRITKSTFPYLLLYKRYKEYTYNEDGTINTIHVSYSDSNNQSDLVYTYTWK